MPPADGDVKAYLARIRKNIEKAENLVAQAELRMAETDRMLERQGLTREQVMSYRFSEAQLEAANAELRRRGMNPIERWEEGEGQWSSAATGNRQPTTGNRQPTTGNRQPANQVDADKELAERQKKFSFMMKPFQI